MAFMGRPPSKNRKEVLTVRVDPTLLVTFKAAAPSVGRAVEEGMRLWLAREKRRQAKDPLAISRSRPRARSPPGRRTTPRERTRDPRPAGAC